MEVEVKFRLKDGVEERVAEVAEFVVEKHESDLYFNHPCRDFRVSDEALRIRKDSEGIKLTYKGAKVDVETKSREEIKISIDSFEKARDMLTRLGFKPVAVVEKIRKIYRVRGSEVIICVDEVKGVGKFIELEIESDSIDDKETLFAIAEKLGYRRDESIRKSYLEMMMSDGV